MELIEANYSALLKFGNMQASNHQKLGKGKMQIQKSPGGSLFPYYYKNGELFGLHLGSYFSDEVRVLSQVTCGFAYVPQI